MNSGSCIRSITLNRKGVFFFIIQLQSVNYVTNCDSRRITVFFILICMTGHNLIDHFCCHSCSIITDCNIQPVIFKMNFHTDPSCLHTVMDSMLYCIFHQRLQDHTRDTDIFNILIYIFNVSDITCKTDIQDIDVVVYCFNLLPEHGVFFHLTYIVTEKICHLFKKDTCIIRITHHCQLRTGIQAVKQKMRIDLRLKVFQLSLLQMGFHKKLPFLHLCLTFHAFLKLLDILPDTFQHLIKASCYNTNLIFNNYRKLRYI